MSDAIQPPLTAVYLQQKLIDTLHNAIHKTGLDLRTTDCSIRIGVRKWQDIIRDPDIRHMMRFPSDPAKLEFMGADVQLLQDWDAMPEVFVNIS